MEYKIDDLKNIAILLSGLGNVDLPENIRIDETALYEYCYDMGWKTTILDDNNYCVEIFYDFLCQLADEEKLVDFIDYYFNKYIENRVADLTVAGYSIFQLKDKRTPCMTFSVHAGGFYVRQYRIIEQERFASKFCVLTRRGFAVILDVLP